VHCDSAFSHSKMSSNLQVKSLLPDRPIASVLGDLLSSPPPAAVATALATLVALRALSPSPESLAPLGRHLTRLPVDVRVGKMLVMGALLGCPGPASTIAAALSGKSPFNAVPPDLREEADRVKARLAGTWKSDHLAVVAAFEGWKTAGEEGGWRAQQDYCQVWGGLLELDGLGLMYTQCLVAMG
jgi:HrpA-like RNA helicase